jgi:mannose-6-phosphate isomerase-like protein (cupin superfamily)
VLFAQSVFKPIFETPQISYSQKNILMQKVNLSEKLSLFTDYWNPRVVGELNNQQVKLVKLKGEFVWHKHDLEDELFLVLKGKLKMEFRDKIVELNEQEFLIVPRGVEHRPVAENEVSILLFEPDTTLNTGDAKSDLTKNQLDFI